MKDIYTETVVHRRNVQGAKVIRGILLALTLVSALLALSVSLILLIPTVAFGVAFYWALQNLEVEYEYIHTNDTLDIDKIMRNTGRKTVMSIDLKNTVLVAPIHSPSLDPYRKLKETDFSDGVSEENLYALIYAERKDHQKVILQLEPKMVRSLKLWMPRKVEE